MVPSNGGQQPFSRSRKEVEFRFTDKRDPEKGISNAEKTPIGAARPATDPGTGRRHRARDGSGVLEIQRPILEHFSQTKAMPAEYVTLVSADGMPTGEADKLEVHQNGGQLHLAFSIFIFNGGGKLLLQKRAAAKYHFAGLWSNTCCGHPRPGEAVIAAARRRLREELGFSTALREEFSLTYEAFDEASGLTEREFLHVLSGRYDSPPDPDPNEASDWRWQEPARLLPELAADADSFTPWFRILAPRVSAELFTRRTY